MPATIPLAQTRTPGPAHNFIGVGAVEPAETARGVGVEIAGVPVPRLYLPRASRLWGGPGEGGWIGTVEMK